MKIYAEDGISCPCVRGNKKNMIGIAGWPSDSPVPASSYIFLLFPSLIPYKIILLPGSHFSTTNHRLLPFLVFRSTLY